MNGWVRMEVYMDDGFVDDEQRQWLPRAINSALPMCHTRCAIVRPPPYVAPFLFLRTLPWHDNLHRMTLPSVPHGSE